MLTSRTTAEQEAFCRAWKQSNTTRAAFCRQNNIGISTLYRWLKNFNSNPTTTAVITNKNNLPKKFMTLLYIFGILPPCKGALVFWR